MKCHSKRSPNSILLLDEVLGPVLADEVDARPGEFRELLRRVVLGRDEHAYSLAGTAAPLQGGPNVLVNDGEPLANIRPRCARVHRASLTIEARFRPVRGFCMRWEKKRSGLHPLHSPRSCTSDPGRLEVDLYGLLQREVTSRNHPAPELGGELPCEVLRHLVAAAPDGGPYVGAYPRYLRAPVAAFPDTPARVPRQPEWTIPTSRSPTSATGTQSATATERQRSGSAVIRASASPASPGSRDAKHGVSRDLADPGGGPSVRRFPDSGKVLVDRLRVVADLFGDVQGVVGSSRRRRRGG